MDLSDVMIKDLGKCSREEHLFNAFYHLAFYHLMSNSEKRKKDDDKKNMAKTFDVRTTIDSVLGGSFNTVKPKNISRVMQTAG